MAVAHDAVSESATFTTSSPATWTHTPVGTPRGVVVKIVHNTNSDDNITGTVSYGGVACTRITTAVDTAGETSRVYLYFLGSGIPTGAQTVSVAHDGGAEVKVAFCETVTAAADTEIVASSILEGDRANPTITLDSGVRQAMLSMVAFSGIGAVSNYDVNAGTTQNNEHDFGTNICASARETTPTTGSRSIGYTASSDDCAMIAVAIAEVTAVATRFYTTKGSESQSPVSPDPDSEWEGSTGGTIFDCRLVTTPTEGGRNTIGGVLPTSTGETLFGRFTSLPLDVNQTISGTVSMVWSCSEFGAANEDAFLAFSLRIIKPDLTDRGVLARSMTATGTEFATSFETRIFEDVALSEVEALAGDRIVLELGVHGVTPAGADDVLIDTGTQSGLADYALTSGLTTTLVGWMELSAPAAITFSAESTLLLLAKDMASPTDMRDLRG